MLSPRLNVLQACGGHDVESKTECVTGMCMLKPYSGRKVLS